MHQFEQAIQIEGLMDDTDEYSTVAGYLLSLFGRLPESGDNIVVSTPRGDLHFEILQREGRRIAKVLVGLRPSGGQAQAETGHEAA
jgi:CBS domain containing-hemolysin-like protein